MKISLKALSAGIMLALAPMMSWATLVTFNATGDTDVSGFVQFDDSFFNGTSDQFVENTAITDLSLTVFGVEFLLADVVIYDFTVIDSTGVTPIIINGAGLIANNGAQTIAFFPDGAEGTAIDGDASLQFSLEPYMGPFSYHAVKWEATVVPIPSAVWLFGSGLIGLIGVARRKVRA